MLLKKCVAQGETVHCICTYGSSLAQAMMQQQVTITVAKDTIELWKLLNGGQDWVKGNNQRHGIVEMICSTMRHY